MRKKINLYLSSKNIDFFENLLKEANEINLSVADLIKFKLEPVPTPVHTVHTQHTVPTPVHTVHTIHTVHTQHTAPTQVPYAPTAPIQEKEITMTTPKMFLKLEVDDELQLFIYKCEAENKDPKQIIKKLVNYYLNKSKQPVKLTSKDKEVIELKEVKKDILNNEAADLRKEKHIIYDVGNDSDW